MFEVAWMTSKREASKTSYDYYYEYYSCLPGLILKLHSCT